MMPDFTNEHKFDRKKQPVITQGLAFVGICLCFIMTFNAGAGQNRKHHLLVVSSYHSGYLWSEDTQEGLCSGLIELGFLDSEDQTKVFTETDSVESSNTVLKKLWMDTKHKSSKKDIALAVTEIMQYISDFQPDLVFLGDDNATNYIGNQLIDTEIPVVFWGVNGLPLKYGLLDTLEQPGHNITGIYQAGYLRECLDFLKKVMPDAKTFAILSDDSPTGRSKVKAIKNLQNSERLPLNLVDSVVTNSIETWKTRALELETQVDAFFVLNHNSIKDANGVAMDQLDIGRWYLENIQIPECAQEKQFSQEGMLCVCDDSGFNQGYEAMKLAYRILIKSELPSAIEVKAPPRGPFIINLERAQMLGLSITDQMGVELRIAEALALK